MLNRKFPVFVRFMDCYWNQDGSFEYGDFASAVRSFKEDVQPSEFDALMAELKTLKKIRGFPRTRRSKRSSTPRYEVLLGRQFSGIATDGDVAIVLGSGLIDQSQ